MIDEKLEKARKASLAKHFKKAAAHHEGHAADDDKCEMAHKAHAEAHEKRMGKAEDPEHDYHKASAGFHKSMANFASKMGKREKEYAEHNKAMAAAVEENDSKKILEILDIKEEDVQVTTTNDGVTKVDAAKPVTQAATVPPVVEAPRTDDVDSTIKKAFDRKLQEAVDAALERLVSSEDFGKKVDQLIGGKLLEKLGSTTIPTDIKTFPVPRDAGNGNNETKIDKTADVPLELLDLVKSE